MSDKQTRNIPWIVVDRPEGAGWRWLWGLLLGVVLGALLGLLLCALLVTIVTQFVFAGRRRRFAARANRVCCYAPGPSRGSRKAMLHASE